MKFWGSKGCLISLLKELFLDFDDWTRILLKFSLDSRKMTLDSVKKYKIYGVDFLVIFWMSQKITKLCRFRANLQNPLNFSYSSSLSNIKSHICVLYLGWLFTDNKKIKLVTGKILFSFIFFFPSFTFMLTFYIMRLFLMGKWGGKLENW